MQLGIALAGAGMGSIFGTTGAMIGWLAGSYAGAMLTAKTIKGSRIEDNTVLRASYGASIPIGYGTIRLAGNIIWEGERIEEKHTSGGKGGPKTETYTYRQSFAVAFANREAQGINKIWIDANLAYDSSSSGSAPDADEQNTIIPNLKFNTHLGGSAQAADAIIEAEKGTGNTPAYRGICYVVFDNLDLTPWGGRKPVNLEAEITFNQTDYHPYYAIDNDATIRNALSYGVGGLYKDPYRPLVYGMASRTSGENCLVRINLETREIEYSDLIQSTRSIFGYVFRNFGWFSTILRSAVIDEDGFFWAQKGNNNCSPIFKFDPNRCTEFSEWPYQIGTWGALLGPVPAWDAISSMSYLTTADIPGLGKVIIAVDGLFGAIAVGSREYAHSTAPTRFRFYGHQKLWGMGYSVSGPGVMDKDGIFWCVGKRTTFFSGSTDAALYRLDYQILPNLDLVRYPGTLFTISWTMTTYDLKTSIGQINHLLYDEDSHGLILIGQNGTSASPGTYAARYDIASEAITDTLSIGDVTYGETANTHNTAYLGGIQEGVFMLLSGSGGAKIRASDLSVIKEYKWSDWGISFSITADSIWDPYTNAILTSGYNSTGKYRYPLLIYLDRTMSGAEDLQTVVEDLCARAGFSAADIEASDLAGGVVRGYKVTGGDAVAALQQLAAVYFFDGNESDWKIKFEGIDKTATATLAEDDLGADNDRANEQALTERFVADTDIPYQVIIDYLDLDRDYETGSQMDGRCTESVSSRRISQEQYPIVLNADEARQVAQKRLYLLWNERREIELQTLYKYLRTDAGDVISVSYDSNSYTLRVKSAELGAGLVVNLAGTLLDIDALVSAIVGDPGNYSDKNVSILGQCELFLFDIPLLRAVDFVADTLATVYTAMKAFNSDWPGGTVRKSADGYQWESLLTQTKQMVWGCATTKLGATTNWETWDRFKTLTVQMGNGTLSSAASEVDCLNRFTNAALLKSGTHWELIQFVDVQDNGGGSYTVSTLLRGLNGTDPYQSGHYAGDLFILLDSETINKYQPSSGEIGLERFYRADTLGSERVGIEKKLTLEGVSLKPWTVCSIAGTRDGSDNLTITWKRRTRANGEWMDGIETVPLNESSEAYEVEVIDPADGKTILRTIDATSETCAYSAAEQAADGLTPGDDVQIVIYQLNAAAGRGYAAEATI